MEKNLEEEKREMIQKQFQELHDKAKELYPNIDEAIVTINNMTARTTNLQDYLNLTVQTPVETANNHITFA